MGDAFFYIGVLQLTVVFLAISAGVIAMTLFKISRKHNILAAWKPLLVVIVLFALVEIVGILDVFNIWRDINFLRHLLPSAILAFLIVAIVRQIQINSKVKIK